MNSDRSPLHRLARTAVTGATVLVAAAALSLAPATATPPDERGGYGGHGGHGGDWPEVIALPDGFQPEGIAIAEDRHGWWHRGRGGWDRGGHGGHDHDHGHGHDADQAFLGSRADGDIWTIDLSTGEGHLVAEGPGTPSLGMKVDHQGRLFVAGGTGGDGRVVDTESGETLAEYPFATAATFVNDVVLTRDGAWFTDSARPSCTASRSATTTSAAAAATAGAAAVTTTATTATTCPTPRTWRPCRSPVTGHSRPVSAPTASRWLRTASPWSS